MFKLCNNLGGRKQKLGSSFQRDYFENQKDYVRFAFHINLFMRYGLDFDFIKIPLRGSPEVSPSLQTRILHPFSAVTFTFKKNPSCQLKDSANILNNTKTNLHKYFKRNCSKTVYIVKGGEKKSNQSFKLQSHLIVLLTRPINMCTSFIVFIFTYRRKRIISFLQSNKLYFNVPNSI